MLQQRPDLFTPELLAGKSIEELVTLGHGLRQTKTLSGKDFFHMSVASLRGLTLDEVKSWARHLYEVGDADGPYKEHVFDKDSKQKASASDLLAAMQAKGITPYVITAGLRILAQEGAEYIGVDPKHFLGAELEVQDGLVTGHSSDVGVIGKDNIVRNDIGTPPLFVFGDSPFTDIPMMKKAILTSFVVHPRPEFAAHAREAKLKCQRLYFSP